MAVAVVVGAQGVIGRYFVEKFAAQPGWNVVGQSRRRGAGAANVRHICVDLQDAEAAAEVPDERVDHERSLLANEARDIVYEALDELPLERRALLVMHDLEGQPVPAIAQAMGAPLNTTYSRLRLARDQFARAVAAAQERRRPHVRA